jgi:hypothetical protein
VAHEFPSADQRILKGVAASLTWQPVDADGSAADPSGTVTVDVTRADGTVIATAAATTGTGSAPRAYALAATANTRTDYLEVVWKVDGVARATTWVEAVGGFYASVDEIRASDPTTLGDTTKYPSTRVLRARWETEVEFERIVGAPFVPRLSRGRYDGTGTSCLVLSPPLLRSVRSVRFYSSGSTYAADSDTNVASIFADETGEARYTNGATFVAGRNNVLVDSEHGFDRPPADVLEAFMMRVRSRLNMHRSGIPDRATTYTQTGGGTFALATPGASWYETGIPDVDATLRRYSFVTGIA